MNRYPIIASLAIIAGLFVFAFAADNEAFHKEQNGLLRHVVCFKFKDTASAEDIQKVVDDFADLQNKIPSILDFECGVNVSPEGLTKGFTHCFILTFKTAKDRDAYLPHPDHKAFGASLGPVLDDVFVIDFWTR